MTPRPTDGHRDDRPVAPRRALPEDSDLYALTGEVPPLDADDELALDAAAPQRAAVDEPREPGRPVRARRGASAAPAPDSTGPATSGPQQDAATAATSDGADGAPAGDEGSVDKDAAGKGSGDKGSGDKAGSLARKAASGARVTVLGQLVRFVVQIGGLMMMSRLLTPKEVGLVAMVTAIVNVAEIVRDFGLSSAAVATKDITDGERTNLFWANVGIGTLCALIVAIGAKPMAMFYHEPRVTMIALALAPVFILSGANTQLRADLSRNMRFNALARSDVLAQVVAVGIAVFAAANGASYWAVVMQQAIQVATGLVSNAIQCRWWPGLPKRGVSIRRFIAYGSRVLGTNLLGYALNNVDNVGLSYRWGSQVVGLYSRAFNLLQMPMTQINAPLSRVALPVLSKVQEDRTELQRYFTPFQRAVCYVLGLTFGMMGALAIPVVRIMLGEQWRSAGPILTVLAIGGVFKVMDSASYQIWLATSSTKQLMRFYLWTRPVMMVIILLGLPWGAMGVAWSGTAAAFLNWTFATWYMCRVTGLKPRPLYTTAGTALLGVVAPASIVGWLVSGRFTNVYASLFVGGIAGLVVVALIALVAKPVRRDLQQVIRLATLRNRKA